MMIVENWFRASDGNTIFYNEFLPDNEKVKFVVQIVHGMAEHSERYTEFAGFLVEKGAAVYASDHRGHGRNAMEPGEYGVWPQKKIWCTIIDDLKMVNDICAKNHPGVPIFVIGHSMGSFLTRSFISQYNFGVNGVILTGSGSNSTFLLQAGLLIARLQCFFSGAGKSSKLLDKMSFGSFNKGYDAPYQWLTRDQKIVDQYIDDPKCGGIFSCSFWRGFFIGLISINKVKNAKKIRRDLPVIFLSGDNDPVGDSGKGVIKAVKFYKNAGLKKVEYKLYKDARHEILNETNRHEVYQDIANWIDKIISNG